MSTSCQTSDNGSDVSGQHPGASYQLILTTSFGLPGFLILGTSLVIGASFVRSFAFPLALPLTPFAHSTFGVNLQKLAHLKNERLPPQQRQPYAKLFTWQLGMLLMVFPALMWCARAHTISCPGPR